MRGYVTDLWNYYWRRRLAQRVLAEMTLEVKRLRLMKDHPAAKAMADYLDEFVEQLKKGTR